MIADIALGTNKNKAMLCIILELNQAKELK